MSQVLQERPDWSALLPEGLDADKEDAVAMVQAAYFSVFGRGTADLVLWEQMRQVVVHGLKRRYEEAGLRTPRFLWESFWARVDLRLPAADQERHVRLIEALMTDVSPQFFEHVEDRLTTDGNVHVEITGPPGLAKSSCAIRIMEHREPIDPDRLPAHLSIDLPDLPGKLSSKQPGEWVLQDEVLKTAGEGSGTARNQFDNLEDTMRGSRVSLIVLSPRRQDHNTMQMVLEVFAWNRERKFSVFLVWLDGVPHGIMAIPWARVESWMAYSPWKAANVERTLAGQFHDTSFLARMALATFGNDDFVQFMTSAPNKPGLKDFRTGLTFFQPQMMAGSQSKMLAEFMHGVCYGWPRIEKYFERWFGCPANAGLKRVALLCYEE